jgi:hypothetical protein
LGTVLFPRKLPFIWIFRRRVASGGIINKKDLCLSVGADLLNIRRFVVAVSLVAV